MGSKSVSDSGEAMGKLQAVRSIPDLPPDCRVKEKHIVVDRSADPYSLLMKEGAQLDKQNERTDRCNGVGGFYDKMKASQEAATK